MLPDIVGRAGVLRLAYERRAGDTVLVENYSRPPLQVMRAIPDAGGCLCVYMLSPTGGVIQEDRYDIRVHVGEGTHGLLTTQSATKVYRMPDGCAEQRIHIEVKGDAFFEFVPDATILFADADLFQQIEVTLHPGALLLLYEIVMPGRLARGECLQFRCYTNRLIVHDAQGLLLYDCAEIRPLQQDFSSLGRLEGYACWGNAYLLGDLDAWGIQATPFCDEHHHLLEQAGGIGGLSPLYRNGIAVRLLAPRLEMIYNVLYELRALIRTRYIGPSDTPLRK